MSVLFYCPVDPVYLFEHADHFVNFSADVRRFSSGHSEQDVVEVLHVFDELELANYLLDVYSGSFLGLWDLGWNMFALSTLEFPEDLLTVVESVV